MTLLEEIQSKCTPELIASKEHGEIARVVSQGRTQPNTVKEIGHGSILEAIGITKGTALLDAIYATPSLKYVVPLLEQGRLKAASPLVAQACAGFVSVNIITSEEAAILVALGTMPAPVSVFDVVEAMKGI